MTKRAAKPERLPEGLDAEEADKLLGEAGGRASLVDRIDSISKRLLGSSYIINPLGGGPDSKEVLRIPLEGFDCVTYVETVLAIARSRRVEEFVEAVRRMRYEQGRVDWFHRNHYMVDWAEKNERRGLIKNVTAGPEAVNKSRRLSIIKDLPAHAAEFDCIPKRRMSRVADRVETGDIILFVSARKNLDVFHAGFIVKRDGKLLLRHATRSKGRVIEQELSEFLKKNRMSGVILLRPLDAPKPKR